MANLLPFTILLSKEIKSRYSNKKIILGGIGAKSIEFQTLTRFPEIFGEFPLKQWNISIKLFF